MRSICRFTFTNLLTGFLVAALLFCCSGITLGDTEETVQSVEVQLNIDEGIYDGLQERIELSIIKVGEKILISQPLSLLEQNKEALKIAIINVFSKVLVGFEIESVDIVFGKNTKIFIELNPLPPLITEMKLDVKINNVAPEINDFTKQITEQVELELNKIFVGLPIAAIDWADGIFSLVINYLVERDFPGFRCKYLIVGKPNAVIDLELTPIDVVVSGIIVDYHSSTMPVWVFQKKNKENEVKFDILRGVPIEFLFHYQSKLENYLANHLNAFPELIGQGMKVDLKLDPGDKTRVNLIVDSVKFRTQLAARYYINENNHYGNFQGLIGYRFSDYELYAKLYLGDNIEGSLKLGLKVPISSHFTGGFEYLPENEYKSIYFNYQFDRGDYLNLEIGFDGAPSTALLGIAINDNLNLELIQYDKKTGIQFLFHFW